MQTGAGVVQASEHVSQDDDDDELLVSPGGQRAVGDKKSYQVVGSTATGQDNNNTNGFVNKFSILQELKDQTTAVVETIIFAVFLGFNLLCLLIGIICFDEGLGTLWMEISDEYEYEFDFGWRKSKTVHKSGDIEFDHSNVYDTDLEAAGEFFVLIVSVGAMMIVSLLLVKILDTCCECCSQRKEIVKSRLDQNLNEQAESWDAFLFIMSVWYGIFEVIYLISVVAFNSEFIENCGDYVADLEQAFSSIDSVSYELTQYECVEGWGMYFQYLNLIMGFTNIILLCQIRKAVNVANEIRKAQQTSN